jgi:AcrR family transcriptional regulator
MATMELIVERGYADTTVTEIVSRAGVSFSTFYENFDDKRSATAAALDAGHSRLIGLILPAYRRGRDWPGAVRSAFAAMFAFYAAEPLATRMAIAGIFAAGHELLDKREELVSSTEVALAPGFEHRPGLPRFVAEAIGGMIFELVAIELRARGTEQMAELAPLATYLTLAPFLGASEAEAVARRRR